MNHQAKELYEALKWAFPLAELAMESHRQERLRAGHAFGSKRVGLYDSEVNQIEKVRRLLDIVRDAEGLTRE